MNKRRRMGARLDCLRVGAGPALRRIGLIGAVAVAVAPAIAQPVPAASAPAALRVVHSAAECRVWQRELDFARSVEMHDGRAFVAHIHPGAVFDAGSADAIRGREAVAKNWSALIDGKDVVLRWRPGVVNIGGDPDVAFSRGPYVLVDWRADPKRRFRVGLFQSVWLRDRVDGEWRVLFDGNPEPPRPVENAEAAERYMAANSPADCTPD